MTNEIVQFLMDPKQETMKLELKPLSVLNGTLEALGFKREVGDESTNGWQVDFFYYYNHDKHGRVLLHGGLWSGDYKLSKAEEDGEET